MPTRFRISGSLKWANILAFILTVFVNGLAGSTTILGGKSTAQVSDMYPTLITPAGYVFSIWGVIYILLGIFVIYQAFAGAHGKQYRERIGWLFVSSCVLNIIWLFLWQFGYLSLSVFIMFLLLANLILIYLRLGIGKSRDAIFGRLAAHLPFSVYLGWITIASIANVASALVFLSLDGIVTNPVVWSTSVIIVALLITLTVLATRKDVAYTLVVIWALIGISVKQSENSMIVVITETGAAILAIAVVAVLIYFITRKK